MKEIAKNFALQYKTFFRSQSGDWERGVNFHIFPKRLFCSLYPNLLIGILLLFPFQRSRCLPFPIRRLGTRGKKGIRLNYASGISSISIRLPCLQESVSNHLNISQHSDTESHREFHFQSIIPLCH